jgi:protein required for attachment to host cells
MIHIVVADARTLRVFAGSISPRTFEEVTVFRNVAAGRHERDLVSDRPGRVINGAAGVHQAYSPRTSAKEHSQQMWLRSIGQPLRELLDARGGAGLLLVAGPRTLSQLRKCLPQSILQTVVAEVPLDVARQSSSELRTRLQGAIRAATLRTLRTEPGYQPLISRGRARRLADSRL